MAQIKTKFLTDNSVTNAKAAQMAAHTFKGNNTGSTANALDLSISQMQVELSIPTSSSPLALNAGGTGVSAGSANAAFNALSPLTTKGDLLGYSTVNARLAVGTDGQVVTADSTQALGIKWATPTTGTVTAVSVVSANGLAGSSSGGATPALTLSTTVTGILQGNGTAISAASTTGTGAVMLAASPTTTGILTADSATFASAVAIGTTNLSTSPPSLLNIAGSDTVGSNAPAIRLENLSSTGNILTAIDLVNNGTVRGQVISSDAAITGSGIVKGITLRGGTLGTSDVGISVGTAVSSGTVFNLFVQASSGFIGIQNSNPANLLQVGTDASIAGVIGISNGGALGQTIAIQNLGTVSAYNFNLPIAPGTAGQVLTSQGGGSSSMTWSSVGANVVPAEQRITLSGTDITNQYVDLAVAIYGASASDNSATLWAVGGPMQLKTVDYTVSLTGGSGGVTRISFAGDLATGGAAALVATDILVINYSH